MRLNGWPMRAGFLVQITACARPGASLPPIPASSSIAYHLGPGDQMRIITLGDDQMTGAYRINDSGAIALPPLGAVPAAGLTTTGLEHAIVHALTQAQLIHTPSVSVEVTTYRPIFVLGEVNHPANSPTNPA